MDKIILKNDQEMKMRVENFEQYAKFPSTDFLMLCELIDNSISSYLDSYINPGKSIKGFKMELIIDRTISGNPNLTITDNSNGMDEFTLEKALILGNSVDTVKTTELNVHGVGLKQSSFFLGRKIEIKTIPRGSKVTYETEINLKELSKSEDQIIRYSIYRTAGKILNHENENIINGTQIKISFLRARRLSGSLDVLIQNLGWKYGQYIDMGAEIKIKWKNNEKDSGFIKVLSCLPKAENISRWIESNQKKAVFIKNSKTTDFLKKIKSDIENISKKENNEMIKSFYDKIIKESDLIWDFNEEIIDGIRIIGQIGILADPRSLDVKQTYVKYNGFSLYQAGRAVACGPNDKTNETKTYNPNKLIQDDISGGTNHKRRWFGWFDLDPLFKDKEKYLQLDTNKRNISWNSNIAQTNFDAAIRKMASKLDSCLMAITNAQNIFCKVSSSAKKEQIQDLVKTSANPNNLIMETNRLGSLSLDDMEETLYTVKIEGENLNFKINLKNMNNLPKEDDFITYESENSEDLDLSVILNLNHDLWKPIVTDEINSASLFSFHKICITFCLSQYIFDYLNNEFNKEKELPPRFRDMKIFRNKTYTDIACVIANRISITNGK
ncbi:ATP-binding protein [Spiroplasma alleghenense]|uniref:Histidine kinase/HSP90-like ATPase domain-containing protein n=1 Tax=Spiroplasma alleghenense TaxID=216931 RepID=A0A345Z597_9MOLU|nr:ATP-binding protein [Spiroplasma alleghenense]AXK51776.1 hypothetical protein SALLE_v1c11060 [Spiroplasma alleghenense]